MLAIILVHFGSPRTKEEVPSFISSILNDPVFSRFKRHTLLRPFKPLIAFSAVKNSLRKYEKIGFNTSYLSNIENLREELEINLGGNFRVFTAAHHGNPSIIEILKKVKEANIDSSLIVPLYPHASYQMYDSIVSQTQNIGRPFNRIHLKWISPFFDHPLFIRAWANCISDALKNFSPKEKDKTHILFSAHAHPIPFLCLSKNKRDKNFWLNKDGEFIYRCQIAATANAISNQLNLISMSIAYQSAPKFVRSSKPSIKMALKQIASNGIENCIIAPISFLFDNVETLLDIDCVAVAQAAKLGFKRVVKALPPGNCPAIVGMLSDIIRKNI